MGKNKTVLMCINFLVEVPESIVDDPDSNELFNLGNQLEDIAENIDTQFKVDWESTQTFTLDPNLNNCSKCSSCGCWVTDANKPNTISQLNIGAVVDGKLLCNECLPKDHELAF